MSKQSVAADLYLEDFARKGIESDLQHLERMSGFDEVRARIREEGRQAGCREAQIAFEAERASLVSGPIKTMESLLGGLQRERDEFRVQNERETIGLAVAIARRLLRAELKTNPELLAGKLAELARLLERESAYVVRVNPGELHIVEALLAQEGRTLFGDIPFRLKPDPRLPEGAVALEGDRARLESICEDELTRLEASLLADLDAGAPDES